MNSHLSHYWQTTYATMQRQRPHIERRARLSHGRYLTNLAHYWTEFLVNECLL